MPCHRCAAQAEQWRGARLGAQWGEHGFCPRAGVGPRNHLIWAGQQKTCLGMLSNSRGGAAGCAYFCPMQTCTAAQVPSCFCSHLNAVMHGSITGVCIPSLSPCSPSLSASLLTAGALKWLWLPYVSSPQGEKPLVRAMPWGWAPHPTSTSLAWLVSGEYRCSLSNLGSSQWGESLCYRDLMLSQVWYSHLHLEPLAQGVSSALCLCVGGADVCLALLVCLVLVLTGSFGLLGTRSSCLWGL